MATYNTISNTQVDPESPVTSELMTALRDNPIAIAEGASGAPRIAWNMQAGTVGTSSLTFTGLDEFAGFVAFLNGTNTSGSAQNLNVALSDDGGSTFATALTLQNIPASTDLHGVFTVDFSSGNVVRAYSLGTNVVSSGTTITLPAGTVDAVRFTLGQNGIAVMLHPQGGESTV